MRAERSLHFTLTSENCEFAHFLSEFSARYSSLARQIFSFVFIDELIFFYFSLIEEDFCAYWKNINQTGF
jgi:hypothetical protein